MSSTGNLSVEAQARYRYISELIQADFPPPARVLEVGSAPGDQIVALARLGYRATSVDIGSTADAWGSGEEGRMRRLLEDAGVADVLWDLEQVPYPLEDASQDVVIMTEVYEHLRDYPVKSLHEVRRILAPGGRLYFTTPNAAYVMNRVRAVRGQSIATPLDDWIAGVPHARHAREYTCPEMRRLLELVGLSVVTATSRHFHLDSGRTGGIAGLGKKGLARLAEARPTLGPSIVMVAERSRSAGG